MSGLSAIVGIVVGLGVVGAGLAFAANHVTSWSAHREVVVVPAPGGSLVGAASLYDSLSRGQVVATAEVIYGQARWHSDTPGVTITSGAITPSAVVRVTATGDDRGEVVRAVVDVTTGATAEVNRTLAPYRAVILDTGTPTATQTGLGRATLAIVAALAGLLAGLVAAGAVQWLGRSRRHDGR